MASDRSLKVDSHTLTLLPGGEERMSAILELIDGAKSRLDLLFYDLADDDSGTRIRDALVAAARRGVEVRLIIDGFGLRDIKDQEGFFAPLREAGGEAFVFHPSVGRRYLLRNHQKIAIADCCDAIIGGANLAKDYLGDHDGAWRDLWLRLDGPSVPVLTNYFETLHDWMQQKPSSVRDLGDIAARCSRTSGPLQWQFSAPWPRQTPWPAGLIRDLWQARQLDMVAAYFSPNAPMLRRMERIAEDGGRVRLITAAKSDNNATIAAARHTYHQLLTAGVEIFEYLPTKLHTKLFIADDIVHIGSSNFDFRSLFINMEVMLRIDSGAAAEMLRHYVAGEIEDSREITPELHASRDTFWQRTIWALSNFLVTTMDYTVSRKLNFPLGGDD
ncbi:phospholipase D-like domain-containing protein [Sphingomicrobium sediminis]|uniref:Phospholipase D n=1 Tax=Sphingomicrobium sediminis TaxID=2950949 RepID=A0A9X2EI24_9SPHN|nr:phosphatidylserine/phosphatidylglycerophosphate/cardiolipin synthase family protein [Sphingomicrobium sediminis]MCM8557886.1 phosphatidylserine/phosphatidylglycerophosphate/cardiolipin synthase family protein [Sphingomicrobium sediminis]